MTSISTQCSIWRSALNWMLGCDLVLAVSHLLVCSLQLGCSVFWFLMRGSNFLLMQLIDSYWQCKLSHSTEESGHISFKNYPIWLNKGTFFCLSISNFHQCYVWLLTIIIVFGFNLVTFFIRIILWWTNISCISLFLIPQFRATSQVQLS